MKSNRFPKRDSGYPNDGRNEADANGRWNFWMDGKRAEFFRPASLVYLGM